MIRQRGTNTNTHPSSSSLFDVSSSSSSSSQGGISKRRGRTLEGTTTNSSSNSNNSPQHHHHQQQQQQQYSSNKLQTIIELSPPHWKDVIHRTAHSMSDAQYGRSTYYYQQQQQQQHSPNDEYLSSLVRHKAPSPPIFTKQSCISTCSIFSLIAMIFLLLIGILLDTQPLYISGALPVQAIYVTNLQHHVRTKPVHVLPLERLPTARVAYQTALAYFITYLLCQWYLHPSSSTYYRRKHYQNIPEDDVEEQDSSRQSKPSMTTGIPIMSTTTTTTTTKRLRRYMVSTTTNLWQRCRVEWKRYWMEWGWYKSNYKRGKQHTPKTI